MSTVPASAGAVLRRSLNSLRRIGGGRPTGRRLRPARAVNTAAPADLRRAIGRPSDAALLRVSGWSMIIFVALLAGFLLHLVLMSGLAEHRSQRLLYDQFRSELSLGTAPVGQVDSNGVLLSVGSPVALISIPAIGVSATIVEGTSGRALTLGPGHRRDTPLPGQHGISVVYGRQAAYGGVFAHLSDLRIGDMITTTTGLGQAAYQVIDVRHAGDLAPALPAGEGRLTLVSAAGLPFASGSVIRVDARLEGKPAPTPQPVLLPASLSHAEDPLASDPSGWLPLFLWGELAVAVTVAMVLALRRWGRWHAWVVGVPVILLIGVQMAKQVAIVLPNLY